MISKQPSAAPIVQTGDDNGAFKPVDEYVLTPTLVLVCGLADGRAEELEVGVRTRLGTAIPAPMVLWQNLSEAPTTKGVLAAAEPMLKQTFWDSLGQSHSFGQVRGRIPIQVLVVWHWPQTEAATEQQPNALTNLGKTIKETLENRCQLSMAVITVGEDALPASCAAAFWPRIRLQSETAAGTSVDQERLQQVTETLLVALIVSELRRAIDHSLGGDDPAQNFSWLWLGASALIVALDPMKEYLEARVLQGLLQPLIGRGHLRVDEEKRLKTVFQRYALEFRERMSAEAREKFPDNIASFERIQTPADKSPKLQAGESWLTRLRNAWYAFILWLKGSRRQGRAEAYWRLNLKLGLDFNDDLAVFRKELEKSLTTMYVDAYDCLTGRLPGAERAAYRDLLSPFALLLNHDREPGPGEDKFRVEISELRSAVGQGLPGVIFAMRQLLDQLRVQGDFTFPTDTQLVDPLPINDREALPARASLDAGQVETDLRTYRRLERSLLSVPGAVLRLLPAWPLLTLWGMNLGYQEGWSALVSAALLALIGASTNWIWRETAQRRRAEAKANAWHSITQSLVAIVPTVLRQYRLIIHRHLEEVFFALERLVTLAREKYDAATRVLTRIEAQYGVQHGERETLYWLADLAECDNWAKQALEEPPAEVGRADTVINRITKQVFDARDPAAYYQLALDLEPEARQRAQKRAQPMAVEPDPVAEKEPQLKGEQRWIWLFNRAIPLGPQAGPDGYEFAVVTLASSASSTGQAGQPVRNHGWLEARSQQPHEIALLRVIAQPN